MIKIKIYSGFRKFFLSIHSTHLPPFPFPDGEPSFRSRGRSSLAWMSKNLKYWRRARSCRHSRCSQKANGNVSSTFSKVVGCWGKAPARSPQRTEFLAFPKIRRGGATFQWNVAPWGTLSRGSPGGEPSFCSRSRSSLAWMNKN